MGIYDRSPTGIKERLLQCVRSGIEGKLLQRAAFEIALDDYEPHDRVKPAKVDDASMKYAQKAKTVRDHFMRVLDESILDEHLVMHSPDDLFTVIHDTLVETLSELALKAFCRIDYQPHDDHWARSIRKQIYTVTKAHLSFRSIPPDETVDPPS